MATNWTKGTKGTLVVVPDMKDARARIDAQLMPNGHRWPCVLMETDGGLGMGAVVRAEVVSWSVWVAMRVDAPNLITVPILWEAKGQDHVPYNKRVLEPLPTDLALVDRADWLVVHARQVSNLSSVLASLL